MKLCDLCGEVNVVGCNFCEAELCNGCIRNPSNHVNGCYYFKQSQQSFSSGGMK